MLLTVLLNFLSLCMQGNLISRYFFMGKKKEESLMDSKIIFLLKSVQMFSKGGREGMGREGPRNSLLILKNVYQQGKCTKYETCAKLHRFHILYIFRIVAA